MLGALILVDLIWLPFTNLTLSVGNLILLMAIILAVPAAKLTRQYLKVPDPVSHIATEFYLLVVFGAVGFICSYLTTSLGFPILDKYFVAIDKSFGFIWANYTASFLQNDALRFASLFFYILAPLLVGFTLVYLGLTRRFEQSSEFIAMFILGGVMCVLISGLLPSAGGSGYYLPEPEFYRGYKILFDGSYTQTFLDIRNGKTLPISILHPYPIIAFPSYHACMAILVTIALWNGRTLGWIIMTLNFLTLLILPVEGGHHLSDILGGLLVGLAAFAAVRKWGSMVTKRANPLFTR